jgi:hypothetical protein
VNGPSVTTSRGSLSAVGTVSNRPPAPDACWMGLVAKDELLPLAGWALVLQPSLSSSSIQEKGQVVPVQWPKGQHLDPGSTWPGAKRANHPSLP